MDFNEFLKEREEFSFKTFGPGNRTKGVIDHIRKELKEIEDNPQDLEEWIDVILLALDGATRCRIQDNSCHGHTSRDIMKMLEYKLQKNKNRKWPDWRDHKDEAICHVKEN